MGKVKFSISMSLDGYSAGPNPRDEEPLGDGGERLHEWALRSTAWREKHGYEGGAEPGPDDEVINESTENTGAYLMGRNMFGGGEGDWGDGSWQGWWGDEPPYGVPVFVLTHHPREPLTLGRTTFHFVTDGAEAALERARAAAGDGDVQIAGGANVAQQYLRAGAVDEFTVSIAPMLLGGGVALLDGLGNDELKLEVVRVVSSPYATHVKYRVL